MESFLKYALIYGYRVGCEDPSVGFLVRSTVPFRGQHFDYLMAKAANAMKLTNPETDVLQIAELSLTNVYDGTFYTVKPARSAADYTFYALWPYGGERKSRVSLGIRRNTKVNSVTWVTPSYIDPPELPTGMTHITTEELVKQLTSAVAA